MHARMHNSSQGSVMKPVPLTRAGHASLMGVSLDIDESVLQAAMPLAAGARCVRLCGFN